MMDLFYSAKLNEKLYVIKYHRCGIFVLYLYQYFPIVLKIGLKSLELHEKYEL